MVDAIRDRGARASRADARAGRRRPFDGRGRARRGIGGRGAAPGRAAVAAVVDYDAAPGARASRARLAPPQTHGADDERPRGAKWRPQALKPARDDDHGRPRRPRRAASSLTLFSDRGGSRVHICHGGV